MSEEDDKLLVERVKKGDKKAFDKLVLKYQHRIILLVSRYVKDASEAEDVAQESFIKAYRALPNFRGDSAFYTWLYRIAINTAKNFLVSKARRPSANEVDITDAENYEGADLLKEGDSPEDLMMTEELRAMIQETIEKLPEELKIAIRLRELDGLSYEEISKEMGCPVGTVRSRIFRAREAVDHVLEPLLK